MRVPVSSPTPSLKGRESEIQNRFSDISENQILNYKQNGKRN